MPFFMQSASRQPQESHCAGKARQGFAFLPLLPACSVFVKRLDLFTKTRGQKRETESVGIPLHSTPPATDSQNGIAPLHSALCTVGSGCSVQTLPIVSDCAKPARPAAATPCLLAPEADCATRLTPCHTDCPGRRANIVACSDTLCIIHRYNSLCHHPWRIYSYSEPSVKSFDGWLNFSKFTMRARL